MYVRASKDLTMLPTVHCVFLPREILPISRRCIRYMFERCSLGRQSICCRPCASEMQISVSETQVVVHHEMISLATCPNDCNANGMCLTLSRLGQLYGIDHQHPSTGGDGTGPSYANWDKDSVTSCFCDPGFSGPDCSRSSSPESHFLFFVFTS